MPVNIAAIRVKLLKRKANAVMAYPLPKKSRGKQAEPALIPKPPVVILEANDRWGNC